MNKLDNNISSDIPLATVLMPVYNSEKYLKEAIESILNQTYKDFVFLIINDTSTDNSEKIILSYNDKRIRYVKNLENLGITKTLNKGIDLINTKYIIRMDADDISLPNRFTQQISFMEKNTHIGISGGYVELFGSENGIRKLPLTHKEINCNLLFSSVIIHPATIIRTKILKDSGIKYNPNVKFGQDYHLWYYLKDKTNFANLDDVLLKYRREGQNSTLTMQLPSQRIQRVLELYEKILTDFGIEFTKNDLNLHYGFKNNQLKFSFSNLKKYKLWLEKLNKHNHNVKKYPVKELSELLDQKWNNLFYTCAGKGLFIVFLYCVVSRKVKLNWMIYFIKIFIKKYFYRNIK